MSLWVAITTPESSESAICFPRGRRLLPFHLNLNSKSYPCSSRSLPLCLRAFSYSTQLYKVRIKGTGKLTRFILEKNFRFFFFPESSIYIISLDIHYLPSIEFYLAVYRSYDFSSRIVGEGRVEATTTTNMFAFHIISIPLILEVL